MFFPKTSAVFIIFAKMNSFPQHPGRRLDAAFYRREDVVQIARELLGKYIVTHFAEGRTVGRIVETEAYRGPEDRGSHAWNNRFTNRTKVMFEAGGLAYIYLCYGIHHLFNVATGPKGMPHVVLIRALEPVENLPLMMQRRGLEKITPRLTAGPGALSRALGLSTLYTGTDLLSDNSPIWLEDRNDFIPESEILAGPRVGIDYAGADALLPWRFRIRHSQWTSR
jgi:DNA-3-methyladenine glycosylase